MDLLSRFRTLWGRAVPGYRLYFIDRNGHIQQAAEFECANDAEAELFAQDQRDTRSMELWSGARRVAEYPARPPEQLS